MNLKHFFTALALTLCTISAAVIITLNFRPLYYMDMDYYNLSENTGYPEKEIRENYDALIDYNSVFFRDALDFPTLPMSARDISETREESPPAPPHHHQKLHRVLPWPASSY